MNKIRFIYFFLTIIFIFDSANAQDFGREPDALIVTKSLSSLPRDIIKVPILKDVLTEDFVFYYRDGGADWLSFRGVLARLAFEHQTEWPMKLLNWILSGPAEIALWKGGDGKLNHFMMVLDQTGVKAMLQAMAEALVKNGDSQLSEQKGTNGRSIYSLRVNSQKTIYLASQENRLFIFSDASMQLPTAVGGRPLQDRLLSFFGVNSEIVFFGPKLGPATHLVTVSANYLSFGYQAFFSSIKALQFEFSQSGWQSRVLTDGGFTPVDDLVWSQMPRGAALCVAVPIDKKKISSIVRAELWLKKAGPTAVACWYPDSKFYAPVIALRGDFADMLKEDGSIRTLFTELIGSREAFWAKSSDEDEPSVLTYRPLLPVKAVKSQQQLAFTREVGGRFGLYPAKNSKDSAKLGSSRFFRVKLVVTPTSLIFSPDDLLVDKSLMTVNGKFPSMKTMLPPKAESVALIVLPEALAKLAKGSILESLPSSQESIFRAAVARHLFPNLEIFGKRPLQAGVLGAAVSSIKAPEGTQWRNLDWMTNAIR